MSAQTTFPLGADGIPKHWYNLAADFPEPMAPPLHPGTREPISPDMMEALLPTSLVEQEMSAEREIDIPQEVRDVYSLYRPTPFLRAALQGNVTCIVTHLWMSNHALNRHFEAQGDDIPPQTNYGSDAHSPFRQVVIASRRLCAIDNHGTIPES